MVHIYTYIISVQHLNFVCIIWMVTGHGRGNTKDCWTIISIYNISSTFKLRLPHMIGSKPWKGEYRKCWPIIWQSQKCRWWEYGRCYQHAGIAERGKCGDHSQTTQPRTWSESVQSYVWGYRTDNQQTMVWFLTGANLLHSPMSPNSSLLLRGYLRLFMGGGGKMGRG